MSKMPEQIKVGRWTYTVSDDAQEWAEHGVNGTNQATTYGMTNNHFLRIVINPGIHPVQKADTLMHECLHAIWEQAAIVRGSSLKDEEDLEELTIGQLTPRLVALLCDNPELLDYIENPE